MRACYTILHVCFACFTWLAAVSIRCAAQVSIPTANGDNNRTNSNLRETQLTPGNVQPGRFGKLGTFPADGQIFAQPLYASGVLFPDGTAHDVLFITTMRNTVYAYDAERPSDAGLLWKVNLGPSFPTASWNAAYSDIDPEVGILGTGAIDLDRGVLYVVAESLEDGSAAFYLHALELATGGETMNGPMAIRAEANGPGAGSLGGRIAFDAGQHIQRPGLLLANHAVYVAFGSHMDQSPWHGWVMTYSAADLTVQRGVFLTTPNSEGGAIWQSGRGLAADDAGGVYSMTGNGAFDGAGDLGESFIKLSGDNALLADWFTPANWEALTAIDADLSTGPAVIPGTHRVVGGDKNGDLYLLDGDSMGKFSSGDSAAQVFSGAVLGGMFNFALWSKAGGATIYVQGFHDVIRAYQIAGGKYFTTPVSAGSRAVSMPRVGMTLSANGARDGILWETTGDGTLHAYDAANLSTELWNSNMSPADSLGSFARFVSPTVVNGKVYVATSSGGVVLYGPACGSGPRRGGIVAAARSACAAGAAAE